MFGNIYLLEKAMERDATERQAAVAQSSRIRFLRAAQEAEPAVSPAGVRILLRIGPLVLAWAVPPS